MFYGLHSAFREFIYIPSRKSCKNLVERPLVKHDFYNTNLGNCSFTVEKLYLKTVIDFTFGRHKYVFTFKSDIHRGLVSSMNITFSGK